MKMIVVIIYYSCCYCFSYGIILVFPVTIIVVADSAIENEMEQLRASVDFLVEIWETSSSLGVSCPSLSAFRTSINWVFLKIYQFPLI